MTVQEFYQGLDQRYQARDNAKTEAYLLDNLHYAQEAVDLPLIIAISNELGGFYRAAGRLAEAVVLGDSVLEAMKGVQLTDTENYAVALINAGNSHNAAKEYPEALAMYKEAEGILEKHGLNTDYRMAALCNNISALYRETEDFAEAEKMATKSIAIISTIPDSRLDLATSFINLGEVQTRMEKFDEAEKSLIMAKTIYETEVNGQDIHYAAAIAALGVLEYYRKNLDASADYYRQALKLIERDFGQSAYYRVMEENLRKVEAEKA